MRTGTGEGILRAGGTGAWAPPGSRAAPRRVVLQAVAYNHAVLAAFVVLGSAFVAVTLGLSRLLQRRRRHPEKESRHECGSDPIEPPWARYRVGYHVYAMLFVVFDIEAVFLYPWAVAFNAMGVFVLLEMTLFLLIIGAGLAYAWKEGALQWR